MAALLSGNLPRYPWHAARVTGGCHHLVDVNVRKQRRRAPNRWSQPTQRPLDGFPKVLQQVEPIRELPCLWCSLACAIGV
jgi:hypothetical protein